MPRDISGVTYFTVKEVAAILGCSRTTLWRWLKTGLIPKGRRYRNLERLFTSDEIERIRAYANRMEVDDETTNQQLTLFKGVQKGDRV